MSRPPAVRGACSRRTRLCTARSLVSTQSWSTKRAWLGNSGHSSVIQDKVRHTQKHKGTLWVVLLSVYISIQIVSSLVSVCVSVYVITRQNCPPSAISHLLSSSTYSKGTIIYSLIVNIYTEGYHWDAVSAALKSSLCGSDYLEIKWQFCIHVRGPGHYFPYVSFSVLIPCISLKCFHLYVFFSCKIH